MDFICFIFTQYFLAFKPEIERWAERHDLGKDIVGKLVSEEFELKDLVGMKMENVKEITGVDDEADDVNCSLINAINSLTEKRQGKC